MKLNYYFFFALIICSFSNCKRDKIEKSELQDFYVISEQDSILRANEKTSQIPPPRIPQEHKWYSDLVFIMDSKDKVYVYQTEEKASNEKADFEYPNYIGLRPEYLITIDSENFVPFLKANNDIFGIFLNDQKIRTFFYVASENDTIKNKALTNLEKALDETKSQSAYLVRKTTEEESIILQYKRNNQEFEPRSIIWSKNFYNGNVTPFTEEYYEMEKEMHSLVLAKQSFEKKVMKIEM